MILFCDTSALVKLYVQEEGSEAVAALAAESEIMAACRIAWAETMAAFARRAREQPEDAPALDQARRSFAAAWPSWLAVEVTQELVELAGDFADTFALRAYDSVQLAALQIVHRELPGQTRFACFDTRLVRAARVIGIASD